MSGKVYLLGDCKPLHPVHRCVWEAISNLPGIDSVAEIGTGAGYLIVGLRELLGQSVRLSASDLNPKQLEYFGELYPDVFRKIPTGVLDITQSAIQGEERPDVVFACTVLMHIQRPEAYQTALRNLLLSGTRFAVLMDNWDAHDYFPDLTRLIDHDEELRGSRLYTYDSGASIVVVVSLQKGTVLEPPFYQPMTNGTILKKYFRRL